MHTQVVLVLRWLRHRLDPRMLAGEVRLSIATAYRYPHKALDVMAAQAPDLEAVLAGAHAAGLSFLCLNGTLIPTDRIAAPRRARAPPVVLRRAPRLRRLEQLRDTLTAMADNLRSSD